MWRILVVSLSFLVLSACPKSPPPQLQALDAGGGNPFNVSFHSSCPVSSATAPANAGSAPGLSLPIDVFNKGVIFCQNDTACEKRCKNHTDAQYCSGNGWELTNVVDRYSRYLEQEYVPYDPGFGLSDLYHLNNIISETQASANGKLLINPDAFSTPNNDEHLCGKVVNYYNIDLSEASNTLTDGHLFPLCSTSPYAAAYCKKGGAPICDDAQYLANNGNLIPKCPDDSNATCVDTSITPQCNWQYVYQTPNEFFSRRLKPGSRPISSPDNDDVIVSPADSRMLIFNSFGASQNLWVKGSNYNLTNLFTGGNGATFYNVDDQAWWRGSWSAVWNAGGAPVIHDPPQATDYQMVIARLAPQDYHRVHMPTGGTITEHWAVSMKLPGALTQNANGGAPYFNQSVNPIAVNDNYGAVSSPFVQNFRVIFKVQADSTKIGTYYIIVVAAMGTNSVQFPALVNGIDGTHLNKGDELAYFEFGGSTVILLFNPGTILPAGDIADNTAGNGFVRIEPIKLFIPMSKLTDARTVVASTVETMLKVGDAIGYAAPSCPSGFTSGSQNDRQGNSYSACWDTQNDPLNCGIVGNRCNYSMLCTSGSCCGGVSECNDFCSSVEGQNVDCDAAAQSAAKEIGNLSDYPVDLNTLASQYAGLIGYCGSGKLNLTSGTPGYSDGCFQLGAAFGQILIGDYPSNTYSCSQVPASIQNFAGIACAQPQLVESCEGYPLCN